MAVATFDTLKFANTLKAAGVPDKQAEAQAAAFAEVIQLNFKELATKDDLQTATDTIRHEVKEAEQRLNSRIDLVKADIALLRWMIGVVGFGILVLLLRPLFFRGGM